MKKVLILTRFRGEYEPRRLAEEALALGYEVDRVNYEHVRLGVSLEGKPVIDLMTGKRLEEYDLVIPRAASKRGGESMIGVKSVIMEYIEKLSDENRPKVINGESFRLYPLMGKLEQGILLAQAGISTIPFVSFNGLRGWKRYLETVVLRKTPFVPVMVKARFGSHGKNVKLAQNYEKLEKLSKKYSVGDVLIQPVIKVRRWYRVLVLNGVVLGMMKHRQKNKFQTEELQSETALLKPKFTKEQMFELERLALKATEVLKADFAGLDIAWDEDLGGWRIFEVNRTAQFKWFEKAHPEINVAKTMLDFGKV
ncbi:MAG TPA: ATP-grasp domain-containing protein [Candidatus Woesebacteria bacterium]|nr:ATP-grasp domain-containing protein [Candidatus Woesebacteria bacterium]